MPFNPNQLASYDEARALRDYINSTQQFVNNNILLGDDQDSPAPQTNPNFPWLPPITPRVGIYLPLWAAGPHADPEPNAGNMLFLHFRMTNGKEGLNVGLWVDKFRRYPDNPSYVLAQLAADAQL